MSSKRPLTWRDYVKVEEGAYVSAVEARLCELKAERQLLQQELSVIRQRCLMRKHRDEQRASAKQMLQQEIAAIRQQQLARKRQDK